MNQNLIYCPKCRLDAKDKVIAEIMPGGTAIAIQRQRSKYSYEDTTLVFGNDFSIMCGYCRTVVYVKREVSYEGSNIGPIWIHRISISQGTISQQAQSHQGDAGTALFA